MEAYKIYEEKQPRYYRIIFIPDTGYGNITEKVYSRKAAFAKYHEIKAIVDNTRPGKLTVYEYILDPVTNNYKENYLCNYRTGKSVDTMAIFNNIEKELQQITNIYNKFRTEQQAEMYSNTQLDIIHGLEIVDTTQMTPEQAAFIISKIQITANLRRQAKNDNKDAKDVMDDLIAMKTALRKIQGKLRDNMSFRKKSTIPAKGTYKTGAQDKIESYLAAIGLGSQEDNKKNKKEN